jgi:hypothetical protein
LSKTASMAWKTFFLLSFIEGIIALIGLVSLPSDGGRFLGYSLQRFVVILCTVFFEAICGICLYGSFKAARWATNWLRRLSSIRSGGYLLLISAGMILIPQAYLDILSTLYKTNGIYLYLAYHDRLAPILNWLSLIGLQVGIADLFINGKTILNSLEIKKGFFLKLGIVFSLFGLAILFISLTGIGLTRDTIGSWGVPAVPVLEWQIWIAAGIALLSIPFLPSLESRLQDNLQAKKIWRRFLSIDLLIGISIWLIAAGIWISQPIIPAYFDTPGRAPNYEIYPFSDGATYEQYAQSILIGNGMEGQIPQRALYIVFLAGVHLIAGQKYPEVILFQSLVLAIFPMVVYFIGKEIHTRSAGILAAMFVIFREVTSIHVAPFTDDITYTKLYFSEIPTAICLSLSVWMFIRWVKNPASRRVSALASGGFLGMAMLIRTQSFIVLPFYLAAIIFVFRRHHFWRECFKGIALLAIGFVLCVSPWLWRNAKVAGGIVFDNSASQTMVLAQRYNNLPFEQAIPYLPGETEANYSKRLLQMTIEGILKNPGEALGAITGHFLNNEIDNLLLFPIRFSIDHPEEIFAPETAFWQKWTGLLTMPQSLILFTNLGLIALGITASAHHAGMTGLVPLGLNLGYNLSTAFFRSSGERFLVPADWAILLYFSAGSIQVFIWLLNLINSKREKALKNRPESEPISSILSSGIPFPSIQFIATSLLFLVIGISMPLSELVFPVRYPAQSKEQALSELLKNQLVINTAGSQINNLRLFAQQKDTVIARGRALFPRYYLAGQGEPKTSKVEYIARDFPRLNFTMVGQLNGPAIFPLSESPAVFPNTGDITVIGCQGSDYFKPIFVLVESGNKAYLSSQPIPTNCQAVQNW